MSCQDLNDEVLLELEAMTAIARALATLEQPARERVMRWAWEKFQLDDDGSSAAAPAIAGTPAAAEQVLGMEPLDALVRELAANFQRLALEWHNGA